MKKKINLYMMRRLIDSSKNDWIHRSAIPTSQEAYEVYNEILTINENKQSLFVSISIEHYSPYLAKEWLEIVIDNINKSMRDVDKISAQKFS